MGGPGAPDDIAQARLTQVWLAASDDPAAMTTGGYFYHLKPRTPNPQGPERRSAGEAHQRLPGSLRS